MFNKLRQLYSPKETPIWFKILNISILLPVLLWPIVFFGTIFFFDNPTNFGLTLLLFIAVNAYPLYLLIIFYFNFLLFNKSKALGVILPITILLTLSYYIISIRSETSKRLEENRELEDRRKKEGFMEGSDDFKIKNNQVYWRDTLIVGADAKSFELVSWDWQRDKNHYYRFGKIVAIIDRTTFKLLDYHYAIDKNNVYYDDTVIEGADPKTFVQIQGTNDAKDSNNCYSFGEKLTVKYWKQKNKTGTNMGFALVGRVIQVEYLSIK